MIMQDNETIFPSENDAELWKEILSRSARHYPERFSEEQIRRAFTLTCEQLSDSMPMKDFWRKFKLQLLWKQEYLPGQDRLW